MRMSQLFFETLRSAPQEAELISHKLMHRAALIQKLAAGIYSFLPLGFRVLNKVINIIREEMNRAGAQEVLLPVLTPESLWQESGRWALYGKEMMRFQDRQGRMFALGPTHEEIITDMVRRVVRSYKQLPVNLYQIQTKFRDEIRPRFGVMRAREFMMKDAYSFDADENGAKKSYQIMYDTYCRIFDRIGFKYVIVEADTGAIGGSMSHEFMVVADTGEETIVYCDECGYAANQEKAEFYFEASEVPEEAKPLEKAKTEDQKTVEEVASFLNVLPEQLIKTLLYKAGEKYFAILIPGNRSVNEVKLKKVLDAQEIEMLSEEEIERLTNCERGYAGPINIPEIFTIIADRTIKNMKNVVVGANEKDYHYINVNLGRDFEVNMFADIVNAVAKDPCPKCKALMKVRKGIEVGHIFYLGDKYSKALKATFYDKDGKEKNIIMGCYGIGVSRIIAAAIEQNHDDDGIIWPKSIAPFVVHIIPVDYKNAEIKAFADDLYEALNGQGVDTIIDDRDVSPGVKFKDADLLGMPYQVVIGKKFKESGLVEVRKRKDRKGEFVSREQIVEIVSRWIEED